MTAGAVYTNANIPPVAGYDLRLYCDHCGKGCEPEHVHEELQLSLIFEPGVCDYTWRDAAGACHEEHIVGPQFLIVAPTVPHTCVWQHESDAVILYLNARLHEDLLPHPAAAFLASDSVAGATHDLVLWQLAATLRQIRIERSLPDAHLLHAVAATVAQRALKVLGGALPLGTPGAPKLSDDRVRVLGDYIQANLAQHIHIADLAKRVGLSVPHLTALFSATMRMSPYKYIARCRMLKAFEMLKSGNYRVAEVALAVGFPDQGYFTVRFKEFFNFSPRSVLLHNRVEPLESPNKP